MSTPNDWINPLTEAVDENPVVFPSEAMRDDFVLMLSQCIDSCYDAGHDCPFDGPQLVAWLESPIRRERMLASFHIGQIRHTMQELAEASS